MSTHDIKSSKSRIPFEGEVLPKRSQSAGGDANALMHVGPLLAKEVFDTVRQFSDARAQIKTHRDSMTARMHRDNQEGRTARADIRSNARVQRSKVDQFGTALKVAVEAGNDDAVTRLIEAIHATD